MIHMSGSYMRIWPTDVVIYVVYLFAKCVVQKTFTSTHTFGIA